MVAAAVSVVKGFTCISWDFMMRSAMLNTRLPVIPANVHVLAFQTIICLLSSPGFKREMIMAISRTIIASS